MICRLWRGWTTEANAPSYERIVRGEVIPGIEAMRVPGFRHIDLVWRHIAGEDRCEFLTLMWFDSLDCVRAFTGEDYERAHVPVAAQAVLADFDRRAAHFQVLEGRPQASTAHLAGALPPLPPSAVLVVIDVQMGFRDPAWGARNNPEAENNIARLLEAWRHTRRPVHHVQHASPSPDGRLRAGTLGHAFQPEAAPLPNEPVHRKTVNSAFIGTSLEQDLRAAGVDTLVLVGLTTNHCVSTTARMAGNLGFRTVVVSDATAAFERAGLDGRLRPAADVHAAALSDLAGEFATIADTAGVLTAAGN